MFSYRGYLIIVSSSRITSQGLSAALGSATDLLMMASNLAQCPEIETVPHYVTKLYHCLNLSPLISLGLKLGLKPTELYRFPMEEATSEICPTPPPPTNETNNRRSVGGAT